MRYLRNTWVTFYVSIAVAGYVLQPLGDSGSSALVLGAMANYPGYLLGIRKQRTENPSALSAEELMVWRIGYVAKVFSSVGAVFFIRHLLVA